MLCDGRPRIETIGLHHLGVRQRVQHEIAYGQFRRLPDLAAVPDGGALGIGVELDLQIPAQRIPGKALLNVRAQSRHASRFRPRPGA